MGKLLNPKKTSTYLFSIMMMFIGILMVFPFIFMLSVSFKSPAMLAVNPLKLIPDTIYLENYKTVLTYPFYGIWYLNTIKVVGITILLRGIFVTMAAYAFAKLRFPFKNVLFLVALSVWMIPSDTTIVGRFLFYKSLHLTNTHWAVILPNIFDVVMLFMLRQFFMQIPHALTEAAVLDGCSHFSIYYKIMLPLTKPALMTMTLFTFIWMWNSYVDPFIFISDEGKQLITVGLQYFQSRGGSDTTVQIAGASMAVIPPVILFTIAQKYFVQGISASGIKG